MLRTKLVFTCALFLACPIALTGCPGDDAAEDGDDVVSLLQPAGGAEPGERLWSPVDAADKGKVEFKRFQELDIHVELAEKVVAPHGLEKADLMVATPDGEGVRVLHTPSTVITLDRSVSPGSEVH